MGILPNENELRVKKEILWVFANALSTDDTDQIKYFYELDLIKIFIDFIKTNEDILMELSLDSLLILLKYEAKLENPKFSYNKSNEGLEILNKIKIHLVFIIFSKNYL